ncbi:hypothetical protein [Kocuria massiliensis]|nr:hypothetical protein [Kocuria massiliensis]
MLTLEFYVLLREFLGIASVTGLMSLRLCRRLWLDCALWAS